ncbi:MAG: hypothetical protein IPM02_28340 [Betaproteobacteria bacterium]|nr:hypothetical protein [Betaproteobacteria bacterium]
MIPQHVVELETIPLLPNGKIDRKSLPAPGPSAVLSGAFAAPETDVEKIVAGEMERVLALPGIGLHDNFFSLGGHSLLAAQLAASLGRALGLQIPFAVLFDAPTVKTLAQWIQAHSAQGNPVVGLSRAARIARGPRCR